MKHTLTPAAVCAILAGLYMVIQFGYFGCRALDDAKYFDGLLAFSKPEKAVLGVEWLMVLIGINILGVATPYANYSMYASALFNVGFVMLLVSTVVMALHLNGNPDSFPVKLFAIDMAFFGAGFAITWVSFWF